MQVSAHKDAVSLFERYGKDGDNPDLKSFAGKTLPKLQEHLKMAQDLEKWDCDAGNPRYPPTLSVCPSSSGSTRMRPVALLSRH